MSEPNNYQSSPSSNRRYLLAVITVIGVLILLAAAAYAGFQLGQSSTVQSLAEATSTPQTATATPKPGPTLKPSIAVPLDEMVTQTRVVEKIVPLDMPAAAETLVPTAAPTVVASDALESNGGDELDLTTFNEVWRLIESEFDGEVPEDQDLLYGAIIGSLDTLDDNYTRFIRPELAELLRDDLDGSVSGIGAIVRFNDERIVEIVRPIDGQPADEAGLAAGDMIMAIDGESVVGSSFDEILLLIRGPKGTSVTLTVVRENSEDPLDFSVVRTEFEIEVVETELIEENSQTVGYVKLSGFPRTAEEELTNALTTLLSQNPAGIILDLRDNGGGLLDQAIAVADLFLPNGIVLHERSSDGEVDKIFRSETGDLAENIPLVVLVNGASASASEIVAGAVKDNGRGILIGEPTYGKGSVQQIHTLADKSELRVTIARWFTPNNLSIGEDGILPDLEAATPEDLGGADDEQLQRAIDYILNGE